MPTKTKNTGPAIKLTIEGSAINAVSPEGSEVSMPLPAFVERLRGARMDTAGLILPDGIKTIISEGGLSVWVHETPPQAFNFKWIAADSPSRFGAGAKYRTVRIALPYLIVFAVFRSDPRGRVVLSNHNECFFSTNPLKSLDDELCYPALLNCSKFEPQEGNPLAWICTQHLDRSFDAEEDLNRRLRLSFEALMKCLVSTGFNYSSDEHEAASWFSESTGVDPRISTVEAWEAAATENPLFALDVPWLKTGLSVRQIAERIVKNHQGARRALDTPEALARLVFNHQGRQRRSNPLLTTPF